MATEITTAPIYGSYSTPEIEARRKALESIWYAKVYLIKSLDTDNDTEISEASLLVAKLDKIYNKIEKL